MRFIIHAIHAVLLITLSIFPNGAGANENNDLKSDTLQQFRDLLTQQLPPNQATVERVFNPLGDGYSLLVRAYASGPQELLYRPLFSEEEDGTLINSHDNSFILRTLPGTDLKEVLINYQPEEQKFQLFFGSFHYGVAPDMSSVSHIAVQQEAAPFLAKNFLTLFVDQPSAALGIRYIFDQQEQQGRAALIQLKREYLDSLTGEVMINSDGEVLNQHKLPPFEPLNIESLYFIEQFYLDQGGVIRYYIQPNGLQSYRLEDSGVQYQQHWIPLESLQHEQPASQDTRSVN